MECGQIEEEEIAEKYVTGGLSEIEQADFEEHFLDCERCFAQVQLWQDMQAVSRRPRSRLRWMAVLAIAASLVMAAGVVWLRQRRAPQKETARSTAPAARSRDLAALAEFTPPRYLRPSWRAAGQTSFDRAMERYSRGDYRGATPGLLEATNADPTNSAAQFFLGICYLMQGSDKQAIARLNRTIALGESPELEEAHFYLGKALLGQQDVSGAAAELRNAIALDGPRRREEQSLLRSLGKVCPAP